MIYEEVNENRRNLTTVWLDYKKAFDSIPIKLDCREPKIGKSTRQDHKRHICTNDQMENQNAYIWRE